LAFLDEEELAPPPGGTRPPSRRGPDRQRQILLRRALGIGVFVIILILLILGIKGCLDARKTRSFENYVSDLNAITAQTSQLSGDFFGKLSDPGNLSAVDFKSEIAADRGTAEDLAGRVDGLDNPGELNDAQNDLDLSYQLRAQAMTGISDHMSAALGNPGPARNQAISSISRQRTRCEADAGPAPSRHSSLPMVLCGLADPIRARGNMKEPPGGPGGSLPVR
jgi:hypothetical protein